VRASGPNDGGPEPPGSRPQPVPAARPARIPNRSAVALAVLLLLPGRAAADYVEGLEAYEAGNYVVAAEEWLAAGSRGDVASQFRLAQLYEQGLGTPQDFVQAHRWYNIAASQGHAEALAARDTLARRLTADQLAEAQRLATQSDLLTRKDLKQSAVATPDPRGTAEIGRFDGRWTAGVTLHYSAPRNKCGFQVIKLGIREGRVKGTLHIGSIHFRDAAAGDYPFVGTVDRDGNLKAEGQGVVLAGVVSDEDFTFAGSWDAFGVGCKGTYEGSKEF